MLPQGFLDRMQRLLGDEYPDFLAAYQQPRNVGLRFNPLKGTAIPALPFLEQPIAWEPNGFTYTSGARPGLHPYHEAGVYYLQEPSAMSAARLLDAQPGERVLDLCAAPGGKSTQLAAAMRGEGILVCNEYHPARAKILSRNIERMGVANALVLNEDTKKLAECFPAWFDKILVDAPCSGEGMFRKEEAAVTDWSQENVLLCAKRQLEILGNAAKMLRGGGRLVYSTCTFAPEENEGVIDAFLSTHPDFEVEIVPAPWFAEGRPEWVGGDEALRHTFRLWPHKLGGEGHFAAVLHKNGDDFCSLNTESSVKLPNLDEFTTLPDGLPIAFGKSLCLAPRELPPLKGLRVLRAGLVLGQALKGRFEPNHALALWAKNAPQMLNLSVAEVLQYMEGQTLPCDLRGWTLVQVDGYSIGWGKASNGILKNHYPKGLRRNASSGDSV